MIEQVHIVEGEKMNAVKVTYTVRESYAETNKANICKLNSFYEMLRTEITDRTHTQRNLRLQVS